MSYCRWSSPVEEINLPNNEYFELLMSGKFMNYCANNNILMSEAYVYESVDGYFVCHWVYNCSYACETAEEMAEYLQQCKDEGALVPQCAIDALRSEK